MVSMPMQRFRASRVILLSLFAGLATATGAASSVVRQADAQAAQLELTSSSDAAKAMFRKAFFEIENGPRIPQIRQLIDSTLALDPDFALARAMKAFYGEGTGAAREQAIASVIADMASVSAPELLLALYWREWAAGRRVAAFPILQSASAMVPGDADVAFAYLITQTGTSAAAEQVAMYRDFIRRFPRMAGAHNLLAYQLFIVGDSAAAMQELEEYVRLAPDHWNSHDSFADVLVLLGRPGDALPHVRRTLELDSLSESAMVKLGLIALMTGDVAAARAEFAQDIRRFTDPGVNLDFRFWAVATEVYVGNGERALDAMEQIFALPTLTPAQAAFAHAEAALIEAYLGDRDASVTRLSAAAAARTPPFAYYHGVRAIVMARAGDLDEARRAAAQYQSMVSPVNTVRYAINALVALAARDPSAARRELDHATPTDLLTKAARADLLMQEGQRSRANAILQEVATSSIKGDGQAGVNIWKLVAKMHADALRQER